MTSIHRTVYPHFNSDQKIKAREMESYYSLTENELNYIKEHVRGDDLRLSFAVLLKVFQRFFYFPPLDAIPKNIIDHIRHQLPFASAKTAFHYEHESALHRHRQRIYEYLNVKQWGNNKASKHFATQSAYQAAQTMNQPADIINSVIESLRKDNYELPAFYQLSRLAKKIKLLVNRNIFNDIHKQLKSEQMEVMDDLLKLKTDHKKTGYNGLKQFPKKPTISNFKELIKHHDWLISLGNFEGYLSGISKIKLQQFSEQARSLDASDLKDLVPAKRYCLIIFLIAQSQCRAKDALATTFCKTMAKMHKKSIEKLNEMQEKSSEKTLGLLNVFSDILVDCKEQKPDLSLLNSILNKIDSNGGAASLHEDCELAKAYNSKNHIPLLCEFYDKKRKTLFRLLETLHIKSTTQNDCLINAMEIILENEKTDSEFIEIKIDLSFTTRLWRKMIVRKDKEKIFIARKYLEMCVFSHLSDDLDSVDLFIEGAEEFADTRKELLDWSACLTMLDEHCKHVNIPNNAKEFVSLIKGNLISAANNVDEKYHDIEEFIIDNKGNPVLKKRGPKIRPPSATWLLKEIRQRMPERNIIDILCSTHHYTGWANVFGPISGSDPKIDNPIERYIFTNFAYGSCMGPEQAAQHIRSDITGHMLSWTNQRHVR